MHSEAIANYLDTILADNSRHKITAEDAKDELTTAFENAVGGVRQLEAFISIERYQERLQTRKNQADLNQYLLDHYSNQWID